MQTASQSRPHDAPARLGRTHPARVPTARRSLAVLPADASPAERLVAAMRMLDGSAPRWRRPLDEDDDDSLFDNMPV